MDWVAKDLDDANAEVALVLACEFRPQSANPSRCESCCHGIGAHR